MLEPPAYLKKYWYQRFSSHGYGCSIMISRSQSDTQQKSIWLAVLIASYQVKAVSLSISWTRQPAVIFTVSPWLSPVALVSPICATEEKVRVVIMWTSVYPPGHALMYLVLTASSVIGAVGISNIPIVEARKLSNRKLRRSPWVTELPGVLSSAHHSFLTVTILSVTGWRERNLTLTVLNLP